MALKELLALQEAWHRCFKGIRQRRGEGSRAQHRKQRSQTPALWGPREMQLQLRVWKSRGEGTLSAHTGWGWGRGAATTSGKRVLLLPFMGWAKSMLAAVEDHGVKT